MTEANDDIQAVRQRILIEFQVVRGTNAWAPWGASGWSAVEVRAPQRKWAQVHRVKPATGERSGKTVGKVRKDQLVRRDPKLKGKDRPTFTPDEVFTKPVEAPEKIEKKKAPPEPPVVKESLTEAKVDAPKPQRTEAERRAAIEKLLALIDDGSTTDDW